MRVAEVRMRFKAARLFLNPLNTIIQLGFSHKSRKKGTPLGYAMSHTLRYAVEGTYPDIKVNPALVALSHGFLPFLREVKVERDGRDIQLRWESCDNNRMMDRRHLDDRVILCAYNPDEGIAGINENDALRTDNQLQLHLPAGLADKPVHLYLLLHDRDKKLFASSRYLGELS